MAFTNRESEHLPAHPRRVHGRVAVRGKTSSQEMKRAGVFSAPVASCHGIRGLSCPQQQERQLMKKSASIFFVLAMLIYSCNNFFTYFAFQLNQKKIIQTHCENTAKPKMHCDGKCHLKKQLKKEEKREQTPFSKDSKEKIELQYFAETAYSFHSQITIATGISTAYSFSVSASLPQGVFQPPKC